MARLLPQQLEQRGLQRLLDLLLLSRSTGLRGLFNSIGARASVNHYHFQLYYFDHPLYIETAPVERLDDGLYQLTAFPAPAFVFEVTRATYADVASRVVALAELILDEGLAFNLVACRGGRCSDSPARPELYQAVRVFVWPRQPELLQEPTDDYQVASCEFAGHITVASAESLNSLTEAGVAESLRTVAEPAFRQLRDNRAEPARGML
ncbi:GDP-D-glucose phosphorylase 1-like [Pollicipes pollicipes]|uniref:GDP-D-glucose phosphorylase 1-like n=1 Tax=Pollicipes pollicipes TaxID=41117 RepID=UPI001884B2F7|nr:GDP-D-glucose phosphorylase 1-like [Pollicipes pollicipes]